MSAEKAPQPTPAEVAAAKKKTLENVDQDAQEYVEGQTAAQDSVERGYNAADTVRGTSPSTASSEDVVLNYSDGVNVTEAAVAAGVVGLGLVLVTLIALGFSSKRVGNPIK